MVINWSWNDVPWAVLRGLKESGIANSGQKAVQSVRPLAYNNGVSNLAPRGGDWA